MGAEHESDPETDRIITLYCINLAKCGADRGKIWAQILGLRSRYEINFNPIFFLMNFFMSYFQLLIVIPAGD